MPTGSKAKPNELNEALNQVIREHMQQRGLTIAGLGREADIPRPTLSRILHNHKDPEFAQIQRVAEALNMPVSKLMKAAEDMRDGTTPPTGHL